MKDYAVVMHTDVTAPEGKVVFIDHEASARRELGRLTEGITPSPYLNYELRPWPACDECDGSGVLAFDPCGPPRRTQRMETMTQTTPDTLRDALYRAADARIEAEDYNAAMERIEAGHRITVNTDKGEDGKPLYGNDKARDAATVLACQNDGDYERAEAELSAARKRLAYAEADAEAARFALRLQVAQLAARAE